MRYTGEPVVAPVKINAVTGGVKLEFATQLDKKSAEEISNYAIKTWALKRTRNYGSSHYDKKVIQLVKATLANDGARSGLFIMVFRIYRFAILTSTRAGLRSLGDRPF